MALGVLLVLVIVRFVSLKFDLSRSLEAGKTKTKEAPMAGVNLSMACSCFFETIWTLGAAVASGLALLS